MNGENTFIKICSFASWHHTKMHFIGSKLGYTPLVFWSVSPKRESQFQMHTLRKKRVRVLYLLNSKEPFNTFGTKVLYRLLFIQILHYSATFCSCN